MWGEGLIDANTGQTAADVRRTSEKGEKPKYNRPMSGGQTSERNCDCQGGILVKVEGTCTGTQWTISAEVADGDWCAGGSLRVYAQPGTGIEVVSAGDRGCGAIDKHCAPANVVSNGKYSMCRTVTAVGATVKGGRGGASVMCPDRRLGGGRGRVGSRMRHQHR